jgi:hypothetical protein
LLLQDVNKCAKPPSELGIVVTVLLFEGELLLVVLHHLGGHKAGGDGHAARVAELIK